MSIQGNGSSSTSGSTPVTYTFQESYTTVYTSASTYKVEVTTSEAGQMLTETAWVLKNGTVLAINFEGQNVTGTETQELVVGLFAGFTLQIQEDALIGQYTGTGYFHSTGTSTVSIGPTQVSVTTYAANSLPVTIAGCNGASTTLSTFSFSVGTPKGASAPLVVSEDVAGSTTSNGQTTNFSTVLQVTSITLA